MMRHAGRSGCYRGRRAKAGHETDAMFPLVAESIAFENTN